MATNSGLYPGSDVGIVAEDIPLPEIKNIIPELEKQMLKAAENLEFEPAAGLRDQIFGLRELLAHLQTAGTADRIACQLLYKIGITSGREIDQEKKSSAIRIPGISV